MSESESKGILVELCPSFLHLFSLTTPLHAHLEVFSCSKYCSLSLNSFISLSRSLSVSSHLWISFLPPFTSNLGSQSTPISFWMCVLSVQMLSNANCDPLSSSHLLPPSILFTFSSLSLSLFKCFSLSFFLLVFTIEKTNIQTYIYILGGTEGATKKIRCDNQDWETRKGVEREKIRDKDSKWIRQQQ